MLQAQETQKARYDQGTPTQTLKPGDQVLVSRQVMAHPTGDPWQEPYVETKVLGPVSYEVRSHPGCREKKHSHINDLRQWVARLKEAIVGLVKEPQSLFKGELPWTEREAIGPLIPPIDDGLSPQQKEEVICVVWRTPGVFST